MIELNRSYVMNRVWCDGVMAFINVETGDQWREAWHVPPDRDLWLEAKPNDVLVIGFLADFKDMPLDASFYTAPREINGS